GGKRHLQRDSPAQRGQARLHLLRWPALRDRSPSLRPHPRGHDQGCGHPVCPPVWAPRLPQGGVGLPRPPRGVRDRPVSRDQTPRPGPRDGHRDIQQALQEHRDSVLEGVGAHDQAPGTMDRLRERLQDHGERAGQQPLSAVGLCVSVLSAVPTCFFSLVPHCIKRLVHTRTSLDVTRCLTMRLSGPFDSPSMIRIATACDPAFSYPAHVRNVRTTFCRRLILANPSPLQDPWFMESVWWVFKSLVEKNLVYRGYKVMPFSTACATPLSNFEAGLNYKDVQDPAVVVAFPLKDDPEVSVCDMLLLCAL
ncbi:unnamed protein product, partial [Ectocarpus sp. 12 AP-2014]